MREQRLYGWGRVGVSGVEDRSEDLASLSKHAVLMRGLGRSYGDSSLPPRGVTHVASSVLADRILSFDASTGVLRAESGFSLEACNRIFLPRGWFTPVTPGTQFVTLGGMVAADVHGKNHHVDGCIGEHVRAITLRVADGRIIECSNEKEPDLFRATLGGMGLTGHILEVVLTLKRVPSPWIWAESYQVPNIDAYVDALKTEASRWPFTMGWIDCLTQGEAMGRGIVMCGRWATREEAPSAFPRPKKRLSVPFVLPSWVMNPLTIRAFNFLYFHKHGAKRKSGITHPDAFFYPLDAIVHWNNLYGPRGFTQYQCVLPDSAGRAAVRRFLELLTRHGGASFLCVIKDCGPEGRGLLSFPKSGVSIALDIPIRNNTQALVDALNERVIAEGGRIYLAKDNFTRFEDYQKMEPRFAEWERIRRQWDPNVRIRSAQSVRMLGDQR